jgi:hypothetical protein
MTELRTDEKSTELGAATVRGWKWGTPVAARRWR